MTLNKLGIFYTHSHNLKKTQNTIDLSLSCIKKSSNLQADILTSVWNKIKNNPFPEYVSWTKQLSHLNQCLQILHLLYASKDIQDYEYVCFLEHDVLYPEQYFNFPEFERGKYLTNMNYMGLKKEGFQKLKQKDKPLHQIVMHYKDAVCHFEEVFRKCASSQSWSG